MYTNVYCIDMLGNIMLKEVIVMWNCPTRNLDVQSAKIKETWEKWIGKVDNGYIHHQSVALAFWNQL